MVEMQPMCLLVSVLIESPEEVTTTEGGRGMKVLKPTPQELPIRWRPQEYNTSQYSFFRELVPLLLCRLANCLLHVLFGDLFKGES